MTTPTRACHSAVSFSTAVPPLGSLPIWKVSTAFRLTFLWSTVILSERFLLAIILPCSSKEPTYNHYTVVKMLKGAGGLSKDSYVLCHQIRTISFDRVLKNIGILDLKNMLKVKAVLLDTLDLL